MLGAAPGAAYDITSALMRVPAGRGTPMTGPEEYRRYARECLELAKLFASVASPEQHLRHMAQVWLRLAQDAENRPRQHQEDEVN